ncbi:hypothetical protein D3C78_1634350 [compost metagenome]
MRKVRRPIFAEICRLPATVVMHSGRVSGTRARRSGRIGRPWRSQDMHWSEGSPASAAAMAIRWLIVKNDLALKGAVMVPEH